MQVWSEKERKDEIDRIKSQENNGDSFRSDELDIIQRQFNEQDEVLKVYAWWKNYNNRQKDINEALHKWHNYVSDSDEDVCSFLNKKGIKWLCCDAKGPLRDVLEKSGLVEKIGPDNFFVSVQDAVDAFDGKLDNSKKDIALQVNK
jgi:hypothetical protein